MARVLCAAVAVGVFFLCTPPARAQVHVQGIAGGANAANWDAILAGALGFKAGPVELDLEGGRIRNALPPGILDRFNELQASAGLPVDAVISLPTNYALATFRLIVPGGFFQPFVGAGAGLARLQPRINVAIGDLPLGDLFGLTSLPARTAPMLAVSGGIRLDFDKVLVEGAYRHHAIYADFREDFDFVRDRVLIDLGSVYVGVGLRF